MAPRDFRWRGKMIGGMWPAEELVWRGRRSGRPGGGYCEAMLVVTIFFGLRVSLVSWLSPSCTGCRPGRVAYWWFVITPVLFSNMTDGWKLVRDWEDELFWEISELTDSQRVIEYFSQPGLILVSGKFYSLRKKDVCFLALPLRCMYLWR